MQYEIVIERNFFVEKINPNYGQSCTNQGNTMNMSSENLISIDYRPSILHHVKIFNQVYGIQLN
jgi:hypothetical protein